MRDGAFAQRPAEAPKLQAGERRIDDTNATHFANRHRERRKRGATLAMTML